MTNRHDDGDVSADGVKWTRIDRVEYDQLQVYGNGLPPRDSLLITTGNTPHVRTAIHCRYLSSPDAGSIKHTYASAQPVNRRFLRQFADCTRVPRTGWKRKLSRQQLEESKRRTQASVHAGE